jgi:cysteine desulfurase
MAGISSGYLDHNATTPVRPEVATAVADALAETGNPSSMHRFGREMRRRLENARERVAALVGAAPAEIVFTSGGTEANVLAIRGSGRRRILISAIEHASVQSRLSAFPCPAMASSIVQHWRLC